MSLYDPHTIPFGVGIADALGGDVRKSDKGWGLGRHTYQICYRPDWMTEGGENFSVGVSHQDQVLSPPPDAQVLAASDFAPHAALTYARGPILSFQGHPEFSDGFMTELYEARRGNPLTEEQVNAAVESFRIQSDSKLMARWMAAFLKSSAGK